MARSKLSLQNFLHILRHSNVNVAFLSRCVLLSHALEANRCYQTQLSCKHKLHSRFCHNKAEDENIESENHVKSSSVLCKDKIRNHLKSNVLLRDINESPEERISYLEVLEGLKVSADKTDDLDELALSLEEKELHPSEVRPALKTSFSLAAYVNESPSLQSLVKLGVDLHKCEKKHAANLLIGLDFKKDIQPYVFFLADLGVSGDDIGSVITGNPFIFQEDLENLQVRVNYFLSKKFNQERIAAIIIRAPGILSWTTKEVDEKLGFLQTQFRLSGNEVRHVVNVSPKIIFWPNKKISNVHFTLKEECGFSETEMKQILLTCPKVFMTGREVVLRKFNFICNEMKISHEMIIQWPNILRSREYTLQQRHKFLEKIGRNQYDPKLPNYISMKSLVSGTDANFCTNMAKVSTSEFNDFLKTL